MVFFNVDAMTGLFPFMLDAIGDSFDLNSISKLKQGSPHKVKLFQCSCKRKDNQDIDHIMIHQNHCKD
jgi:hypothetical protein